MRQTINLYQFILDQRNLPLSFRTMLSVFYGFLLLLLFISGILLLIHLKNIHDLKKLEEKQSLASRALQTKSSKVIPKQTREQIQSSLAQQEKIKTQNERTLDQFKNVFNKTQQGFSEKLISLAKSAPTGLWLTRIEFLSEGDFFSFSGKTIDPFLITDFIDALSEESTFSGKSFQIFSAKLDPKENVTEFTLKSKEPAEETK